MRPALEAIAACTGGVVTRRDALSAGYTERELKTLTGHAGAWVVVRRGCYVERWLWDELDDDGRYALQAQGGVKHHLVGIGPSDITLVGDTWCTSLARTAVDVAREHGFADGVVAADAALRLGATREELQLVLRRMRCWPHVTDAREAARVADGGAANPGESLLRVLVLELDIGAPQTQHEVREGSRVAFADLRVGRHLFEFDGRVTYLGRDRGGVSDRRPDEIVWEEKQREDMMRRAQGGHGVSRVVWDELLGAARAHTKERLRREFDETERRFGRGAG